MKYVRPSDAASMGRMLAQCQAAQPTYSEIGSTLVGDEPPGFRNDHYEAELGKGADTFARAVQGLRTWGHIECPECESSRSRRRSWRVRPWS